MSQLTPFFFIRKRKSFQGRIISKVVVKFSYQNIGNFLMPLCGMEAPAEVEWSTAGKWRRRPAQPAAVLIGSASPPRFTVKPYPGSSQKTENKAR
ncbi:hypothetical protein [Enterobacter hormaechei]|uniref:hypothetical protein n=1 Tax=Enterobacter hormaechei TaxID=158836 RepID=UPI003CF11C00